MTETANPLLQIDINAAYERGIVLTPDRGDEHLAHIGADVAGMCDREGWARRVDATEYHVRGYLPAGYVEHLVPHDVTTRTMFGLGHAAETLLLDAIDDGLPDDWRMMRPLSVALYVNELGELAGVAAPETDVPRFVYGHLDAVLYGPGGKRIVIDTKSTVWWNRVEGGRQVWYPKGDAKLSHILQVCAYALAIDADTAVLYELDLGGKARRTTTLNPEAYRAEITERVAQVLDRTDPTKPMPPAEPNPWAAGWACGSVVERFDKKTGTLQTVVKPAYCRFTACERHLNAGEASR